MADQPVLDSYWAQYFATWDEWDNTIEWLFPSGVSVAGIDLEPERIKELGRFSPNTYLSIAVAAAVKQGLGQDRVQALRDFAGVIDPLEYDAKTKRRGGGGDFGRSFVDALAAPLPEIGALMAQVIVPNGYRVAIRSRVGTQSVVNVLHFLGGGPGLEQACAAAARAAWVRTGGPWANTGNTATVLETIEATDLSSTSGGIYAEIIEQAGTVATQLATAGAAALVQFNGQTRNRSARGRMYLGPLRENVVEADGRTLSTAGRSSFLTAVNQFQADMAAAGFTWQVLSRIQSVMYPVTLIRVAPIIATQRRRIRS